VVIPSGNLGIGTDSPATPFNINKLTATVNPKAHTTTEFIRLRGDKVIGQTYAISGGIKLGGDTGGTATADGRIEFYANDGADVGNSYGDVPDNFIMCMRGDGNVGIGTTSPDAPLTVQVAGTNNTVRTGLILRTPESDAGTGYNLDFHQSTTAVSRITSLTEGGGQIGMAFSTYNGSIAERMRIGATGNVGIGTVSPSTKLHVQGTSSSSVNWIAAFVNPYNSATTGQGSGIKLQLDGANAWYGDDKWSGITSIAEANWGNKVGMAFYTQGNLGSDPGNTPTEKMRISGSGNVGIGTTSPYGNLHVYTGGGGPSSADCLVIGDPNGSAAVNVRMGAASDYAWIQSHEGSPLRINPGGNTITYGNANTTLSDDRIKDNEEYIRDATQTLVKLKPQIYDKHLIWDLSSEDASNVTTVRESGLITQDVWYDAPELRYLVHLGREAHPSETKPYTDDDPQNDPDYSTWGNEPSTLNYTGLIPYLIKSNQELYTDLQAEKVKVATLETQLASVLARLDALESA
jgi:hypothetical protein